MAKISYGNGNIVGGNSRNVTPIVAALDDLIVKGGITFGRCQTVIAIPGILALLQDPRQDVAGFDGVLPKTAAFSSRHRSVNRSLSQVTGAA